MTFPWAVLAAQGIGMLGKKLFNEQVKPNKLFGGFDPSQYKDEMTLDDSDLSMLRNQNLRNVQDVNMKNVSEIKKAGAARRLPSGALLSALKGSSYEAGRGASNIEPQLKQAQIGSFANYLNMMQPYEMAKANLRAGNAADSSDFFGQGFGDMAKTMLLWKAGLLGGSAKNTADAGAGTPGIGLQYDPSRYKQWQAEW